MKKQQTAICWSRTLLTLTLCLCLTGCSTTTAPQQVYSTLPPATTVYEAPAGDGSLDYIGTMPLYLPSLDGQRLICVDVPVSLNHGRHPAEAVTRALLAHSGNQTVQSLGAGVQLSLSGAEPVEVSGGVCTVNLSSSALALTQSRFHVVAMALTTTLSQLPDIQVVNILVAGQPVGMDITGNLPLGSLTARMGEELPLQWERLEAKRTPLGEDPSTVPVTAVATLYFPLADGSGILPEVRNITFPGQSPQQLAQGLLEAMDAGALYQGGASALPSSSSLQVSPPQVSDLTEGGRLVTLKYHADLLNRLEAAGVDAGCYLAGVVMTLTTFIPSAAAVNIQVGNTVMTSLRRGDGYQVEFTGGLARRSNITPYLVERVEIYLARDGKLTPVERTVPWQEAYSPRVLLNLLMNGPTEGEREQGITAVLPGNLLPGDVTGFSIQGDTLLVGLSDRFSAIIASAGTVGEQQLAYGMVNTLLMAKGLKRAVFFFGGKNVETLAGSLYWAGEFLQCPGLIDIPKG